MSETSYLERRAERLVRWYPERWRARYGNEFTQLLVDELGDGERALYRSLNIVVHGLWTRVAYSGLAGTVLEPRLRLRAKVAALIGVLVVFLILAAGIWSQLTVGWQWSAPTDAATRLGISIMSGALFGLGGLVIVMAGSLTGVCLMRGRHRGSRTLWGFAVMVCLAAATLWFGSDHFAAHWPGTGGHAWSGRGVVPASLARVVWAATLCITTYWAHPAALSAFPTGEVVWMLVSPLAWVVLICAAVAFSRQIRLTDTLVRCTAGVCAVALGLMTGFLVGAVMWMSSGQPGPQNLFAVGTIDLVIVGVLAGGLTAATHLVRRLGAGTLRPVSG